MDSGVSLQGLTAFITGGTRGIGLAIARRLVQDGVNIALIGKTVTPHKSLPGTLSEAEAELRALGGNAISIMADVRDEEAVQAAVARAAETFGGIDLLINNASAIQLSDTAETPIKRFDLMHGVNVRGTFVTTQMCLPFLKQSRHAHVLTLSPPLALQADFFAPHVAYSLSKFGMSLCTLGWAKEFAPWGISVSSLWPKTIIDTSAVRHLLGAERSSAGARHPSIVAEAARLILKQTAAQSSGRFFLDEDVLAQHGTTDLSGYAVTPGSDLVLDLFVSEDSRWI